ncbi:MAG: hypothetical protein NC084_12860 [Bacteroides sp.]|nr:hypothetical protein [Eubacterium sp.]MCM1419622.1 hypothetical protein [Roseburia sp.]MCM1463585.1 hypothetical protein [Bacteroides sp.]
MAKDEESADRAAHLIAKDGEWFPGIASYSADLEDIDADDTARSETGKLIRNRLRAKVIKLSVTHKLDGDRVAKVARDIGDATVELTVFCPASEAAEEGYVTAEFYVSKISSRMIVLSEKSWWEVSYNAIQV